VCDASKTVEHFLQPRESKPPQILHIEAAVSSVPQLRHVLSGTEKLANFDISHLPMPTA